jgi:drug/metabolite transporter (DMT)-like permease
MPQNWRSSPALALLALLIVTAIWGSTFIVVQDAVAQMPVMDFLAVRFGIAALFMLVMRPACLRGMSRTGFMRGGVLGLVLGLGYITQTFGLQHTSATVSGFITGMSVVLTPVVLWGLLRRKIGRNIWVAVVLAVTGLAFLSLRGWAVGWGELLTLGCALCFALHIVGLGEWSAQHDIYGLVLLQIATVAVISLLAAAPGGISLPPSGTVWLAVLITAVLATALAFVIQGSITGSTNPRGPGFNHGASFCRFIRRATGRRPAYHAHYYRGGAGFKRHAHRRAKIKSGVC